MDALPLTVVGRNAPVPAQTLPVLPTSGHGAHAAYRPQSKQKLTRSNHAVLTSFAALGLRRLAIRGRWQCLAASERGEIEQLLEALQGVWEDDVGLSISVKGTDVDFGDGSGPWEVKAKGSSLYLRGTRFIGSPEAPAWEFPNGVQRTWSRPEPLSPEQETWRRVFLEYKAGRLQLRRQLWASLVVEDGERSKELLDIWNSGNATTLESDMQHFWCVLTCTILHGL